MENNFMKRYLCIHGHFYQPPRENPWLEEIEIQDSAHPYHDWNERILAECYLPNTAARVVDHENRILDIVNNYAKISFNFGPTLLSWMERAQPEVYRKILEADQISVRERGGHGNALAQVYNHVIMPLASRRDKVTQVRWGIADFESRFRRKPEGMWLPETAVDLESLQVLAEEGIRFTILAPHQARRIRRIAPDGKRGEAEGKWEEMDGIDPTRPYRCFLSDGLFIDLFFYDGPISHSVAFDRLLRSGEAFVERLRGGFSDQRDWPQLLHIATDGESYGHHFAHGDMALAYTLQEIERQQIAEWTNYGEYLSKNPPTYEVEIAEQSAWSCFHGVERWRSDCGCQSGGHPDWNQRWRQPLRVGLDALKSALDLLFETKGEALLKDPWQARDHYITLIRKREENRLTWEEAERFLSQQQARSLTRLEQETTIQLLEMQRNALLMFTSCAWFFDDISGLEATQNLKYADRAIQLAKKIDPTESGERIESILLERLKEAKSNLAEFGDGVSIYHRFVGASIFDAERIIAHYAIASLFEEAPQSGLCYSHQIELQDYQRVTDETVTLAIGRVLVTSLITFDHKEAVFGVVHFGGHDFHCAVGHMLGLEDYGQMKSELVEKFYRGSQADVVRGLNHALGEKAFSLKDLFIEPRRKILSLVTDALFRRYENIWRQLYLDHQRFMLYLSSTRAKVPKSYLAAAEQVLNHDLKQEVAHLSDQPIFDRILQIIDEAKRWKIDIEVDEIEQRLRFLLNTQMQRLVDTESRDAIDQVNHLLDIADRASLEVNLWKAQNLFHQFIQQWKMLRAKDHPDRSCVEAITKLAARLSYHWNEATAKLD
jgi:alpha-amylase/alpha-mannosidase (GH57 family)